MKRVFTFALLLLMLGCNMACAEDKAISADALPTQAKQFLASTFPQQGVVVATVDRDIFDDEYKVMLDDGTHIEFDRSGNWESLKHKGGALPTSILPHPIIAFIGERFAGVQVTKIERDNGLYELDLMNGVELKFDRNFNCTEVDL